ncbi:MAG TPA: hypothetical protein VFG85_04385 [Gaiellaceae bacterium]|jgi:uncharacterized protein DUF6236|nr:hypothetical protein [Gaiellaceae bacterium]
MANGVLYFPYISVPRNAWFTRVLLYWDQVGSIVPERHADDLGNVSGFMRDLVEAGLVLPIVPERYDYHLMRAVQPFLDFVDSDPEILARAKAGFGPQAPTRGGSEPGTAFRIHRGKFSYILASELENRGLARPAGGARPGRDWLEVESRTATAYMAYLSTTLGAIEDVELDPITDTLGSLTAFSQAQPKGPLQLAADLRMGVLESVLPGPSSSISVSTLIRFKERHGELLARFRRHLESQLLDLAVIPDADVRAAKRDILTSELQDQVAEIQGLMRPRWTKLVFGTLCSVLGAAIPVGVAAATGALPIAAAGLPGLANAAYTAQAAVRGPGEARNSPLAYAALARQHLLD